MASIPTTTVEDIGPSTGLPNPSTPPPNSSTSDETTRENPGHQPVGDTWTAEELELEEQALDATLQHSLPVDVPDMLVNFSTHLRSLPDEDARFKSCHDMRRCLQLIHRAQVLSDDEMLAWCRVMLKESPTIQCLSETVGIGDGSTLDSWEQFFRVAHEAQQRIRRNTSAETSGIADAQNSLDRNSEPIADAHISAPLASIGSQLLNASSTQDASPEQHVFEQPASSSNGFQHLSSNGVVSELPLRGSLIAEAMSPRLNQRVEEAQVDNLRMGNTCP